MKSKRTSSTVISLSRSGTLEPQTTSRVWRRFWPVTGPSSSTAPSCAWTEEAIPGQADISNAHVHHRCLSSHWSEFERGGHFAAMEEPDLFVGDLRRFASTLKGRGTRRELGGT